MSDESKIKGEIVPDFKGIGRPVYCYFSGDQLPLQRLQEALQELGADSQFDSSKKRFGQLKVELTQATGAAITSASGKLKGEKMDVSICSAAAQLYAEEWKNIKEWCGEAISPDFIPSVGEPTVHRSTEGDAGQGKWQALVSGGGGADASRNR